MPPRRVAATRFVTSLIEGGSRPALVKADDGELYVAKLRGAAQGVPPLASEVIAGEIARRLDLNVPEIVLIEMDRDLAKGERDTELRELLQWSAGINVGLRFVPESTMYERASAIPVDAQTASRIVWLDAYILNVDRTDANPNLLVQGREVFLIDHGAALFFHFHWAGFAKKAEHAFAEVLRHVMLPWATKIGDASRLAHQRLDASALRDIVDQVPDELFAVHDGGPGVQEQRAFYLQFLADRLAKSSIFESELERAHEACLSVRGDSHRPSR